MKQPWYFRKWVNIAMHCLAWIILFSLPYFFKPSMDKHPEREPNRLLWEMHYLLNNILLIGIFYLQAFVLVPHVIYKKKISLYILIVFSLLTGLVAIRWLFVTSLINANDFELKPNILFSFFTLLFMLFGATTYIVIKEKMREDRIKSQTENETLKTELSFLRSQASPHFMFNVLNNMVALARKKSDQLEPSLIKLSSLMRYMLYETDEDKVPVEKEAEYLQSYIDLQRQRFGKNVHIDVNLDIDDGGYEIEPMLLIPFVENAFKHGTGLIPEAHIEIKMEMKKNTLHFFVANRYDPRSIEVKDKTSGIGLTNVKRRLNLLYAAGHSLTIERGNERFAVSLKINLH
ncbi:histidine kinase [Chitinophaga horti]|uniref:Histidine kinase n=1 Tax=Chitinophaga horti TaxID=2920382 RepID=A0ABY6J6C1_9BACT|nr:histidine kinase [Chitinophaga horti]UYQ95173.1 histidine kinase [Chitinophaga horti]